MPRNAFEVCDGCGGAFSQGFGLINHKKVCEGDVVGEIVDTGVELDQLIEECNGGTLV